MEMVVVKFKLLSSNGNVQIIDIEIDPSQIISDIKEEVKRKLSLPNSTRLEFLIKNDILNEDFALEDYKFSVKKDVITIFNKDNEVILLKRGIDDPNLKLSSLEGKIKGEIATRMKNRFRNQIVRNIILSVVAVILIIIILLLTNYI